MIPKTHKPKPFPSAGGVVADRGGKKPRPDQTAGQGKGLWAEASFCLDFLNTFLSRKKYE